MGKFKYEVGQKVFVPAEVEAVCIDEHGITYGLKIRDSIFTDEYQSNVQHVCGIAESDIRAEAE